MVVDLLGRGGMGVVYKAFDPELDRLVALKLVRPGGHPAEAAVARERLVREARALAKLAHPNVVAVHDVGVLEGDVFLALEYVEGQTLRRWQSAPGRRPAEIVEAYVAAGWGLEAAHRAGLVHRDFKPDNVLISAEGRVRVLDFGLVRAESATAPALPDVGASPSPGVGAKRYIAPDEPTVVEPPALSASDGRTGPGESELTRWGQTLGTLRYMAPEQFAGAVADARSDQFSFCIALYEALYGEPPFPGDTLEARLGEMVLGRRRTPPIRAGVAPALGRVLGRGLSLEPAARFESMPALLHELTRDHRPWWRRRGLAVGLGLAAVAGASWAAGARGRVDRSSFCRGLGERVETVWDGRAQAKVREAFAASKLPYAAESLRTVEGLLDSYRQGWAAARLEACEATRVRGEQSEELLDLRMQCLDRRLMGLRLVVDGLSVPDVRTVENAVQAAKTLEPLADCADVAALRAPSPWPSAPSKRAQASALRDELVAATTDAAFGHNDEALARAERLVVGARALGHPPLLAEALMALSEARRRAGDVGEAEKALYECWVETERGNHAALRPLIWARLAWFNAAQHDRADQALALTELARVALGDTPSTDPTWREVERRRLGALNSLARHDEANVASNELLRRAPNDRDVLHNVALNAFERGEYDFALSIGQRELQLAVNEFGASHPLTAGARINIGMDLSRLGRCRESLAEFERIDTQRTESTQGMQYFVYALVFQVYALVDAGRPRDALTLALARGHEARLSPSEMAGFHLQIAMAHIALGHDKEAAALVAEVERSAVVRGERSLSQRRVFVALASVLLALAKPKQAEYYLQAVESSLTPTERQSRMYYPFYLTARAWLEMALGRPAEARRWAGQSRALMYQTSHVSLGAEAGTLFVLARTAPDRATGRKLGLQLLRDLDRSDCTDPVVQRQLREWLRLPGPARGRP